MSEEKEEKKTEEIVVQQEQEIKPEEKKKPGPKPAPEPPPPPKQPDEEQKSFLEGGSGDVEKHAKDFADLATKINKDLSEDLNANLGKKIKNLIKNKWKDFKEDKELQEELGKIPSELRRMPGKVKGIIKDHYNSLGKNSLSKPPDSAKVGKEPEAMELKSLPDLRQQRQQTPAPKPEVPDRENEGPAHN